MTVEADWMTGTKFQRPRRIGTRASLLKGTQFNLRKIDFMKRRSEVMYSSMTCWRSSMRDFALFD